MPLTFDVDDNGLIHYESDVIGYDFKGVLTVGDARELREELDDAIEAADDEDLWDLIDGWRNSARRHRDMHEQIDRDVSEHSASAKAFQTAANELERTLEGDR